MAVFPQCSKALAAPAEITASAGKKRGAAGAPPGLFQLVARQTVLTGSRLRHGPCVVSRQSAQLRDR